MRRLPDTFVLPGGRTKLSNNSITSTAVSISTGWSLWHRGDALSGICAYKYLTANDFFVPAEPAASDSDDTKYAYKQAVAQRKRFSKWKGLYGTWFANNCTIVTNPTPADVAKMYKEAMTKIKAMIPKGKYTQQIEKLNPATLYGKLQLTKKKKKT